MFLYLPFTTWGHFSYIDTAEIWSTFSALESLQLIYQWVEIFKLLLLQYAMFLQAYVASLPRQLLQ